MIKDWKKRYSKYMMDNHRELWTKDLGNAFLGVGITYSPNGIASTPFVVDITNKDGKIVDVQYFKTKALALKFAKKYMEAH